MLEVNDVLKAVEEPLVNLCEFFDALNGVTFFQRLSDSKHAEVSGVGEFFVKVVKRCVVVAHEAVHALTNHAKTLLNDFFEATADRHDFTY